MTANEDNELVYLSVKITRKIDTILQKILTAGNAHATKSELVREMIRKYLEQKGLL